jgi:predicted ATPase
MHAATLISLGRSTEALAELDISYRLYQDVQLDDFAARFAQDPGVQILCYKLLALWMHGDEAEAVAVTEQVLRRARELKHANTLCYAGLHAVMLSIWRGDTRGGRQVNDEMRRVAIEHDMALWKTYCDLLGGVLDCMDDLAGAVERLEAALSLYQESGCGLWVPLYLAEEAKHLLRNGDVEAARRAAARAVEAMEAGGERWVEAELWRIEGEIRRREGNRDAARQAFETALAVARKQEAYALEPAIQASAAAL